MGKTTLARQTIASSPSAFYDLEDHRDLARLAEPTLALRDTGETIVIERAPATAGVVPDASSPRRRGSPAPAASSCSAARRPISSVWARSHWPAESPLSSWGACGLPMPVRNAWTTSGCAAPCPESFVAVTGEASNRWRDDYISTFLERDLANLGFRFPATTMRRFWTMLAHYHGQTWNGARIARSIDVSESTVRRYIGTRSPMP